MYRLMLSIICLHVVLGVIYIGCSRRASIQDIVDNCSVIDTIKTYGHKKYGSKGSRVLYGNYSIAVFKCNDGTYDSITLQFEPSPEILNTLPSKTTKIPFDSAKYSKWLTYRSGTPTTSLTPVLYGREDSTGNRVDQRH